MCSLTIIRIYHVVSHNGFLRQIILQHRRRKVWSYPFSTIVCLDFATQKKNIVGRFHGKKEDKIIITSWWQYFGFCQIMHIKVCKKLFVWFMMLMLECHKSLLRIHFIVKQNWFQNAANFISMYTYLVL